jgi:hypothetical protein
MCARQTLCTKFSRDLIDTTTGTTIRISNKKAIVVAALIRKQCL